jgi:hypothetical protein
MLYINHLTDDAQQQTYITGIPDITINFTLRFLPRIQTWIMGVSYNDFSAQGIPVTTSPNILRQFRNQIPFGIACVTASGLDPYTVEDFLTQASNLYLLNSTDVQLVEVGFFQ